MQHLPQVRCPFGDMAEDAAVKPRGGKRVWMCVPSLRRPQTLPRQYGSPGQAVGWRDWGRGVPRITAFPQTTPLSGLTGQSMQHVHPPEGDSFLTRGKGFNRCEIVFHFRKFLIAMRCLQLHPVQFLAGIALDEGLCP